MSILCIPMKVDALLCDNLVSAVTTQDDFSKLPYQDEGQRDISSGVANIASSIARDAFNNNVSLPAGVHLHWSMPDALTKGTINNNYGNERDNEASLIMPKTPNRWLIIRQHKTEANDTKKWVVESDFVHPEGQVPKRAICIPNKLNVNQRKANVKHTPYCYVGRQVELDTWLKEDKSDYHYLEELTVLGWGSPYFSALYTDCYSVFGAYDAEVESSEDALNYSYEVYGWYSKDDNDYVKNNLNVDTQSIVEEAKTLADWDVIVGGEEPATDLVSGMVCFGMVEFDDAASENLSLDNDARFGKTEVCMAKSPYEAVSTYLSKALPKGSAEDKEKLEGQIENQIQALLYNDDISGTNVDFIDRLKKVRHKEEFKPINSGVLWDFVDEGSLFKTVDKVDDELREKAKTLFQKFKKENLSLLKKINNLQQEMNDCMNNRQYYRRQLYNDWSKYMLCLHPTDVDSSAYPDPEKIRYMIERDTLPRLEEYEAKIVILVAKIEAVGEQDEGKSQLKFAINSKFTAYMKLHGVVDDLIDAVLLKVPGPRYWKAMPPSVLISGDVVQHSDRHGADACLKCQLINTTAKPVDWLMIDKGEDSLDWSASPLSVNNWSRQPWSPLFMEWKVALKSEYSPLKSITANQENYSGNYITDNYRVALNDDQYSLPSAAVDLTHSARTVEINQSPTIVNGRSLFTFSNKIPIEKKLNDFKLDDNSKVESHISSAAQLLNESKLTVQSLDGMHDDLLMYSNATALKIFDPLSYAAPDGYTDNLTQRVANKLNNTTFKLPKFGHDFLPIKCGTSRLERLRVVDSFGRYQEIDCDDMMISQRRTEEGEAFVAPRVLQPLRLSVRWEDDIDVNQSDLNTPVCGWLCYNHFDESFVIYDADGKAQGAMNSDGEWVDKDSNFEDLSSIHSQSLKSFILKVLSFHDRNRIVKSKVSDAGVWSELVADGVLLPYGDGSKAYLLPFSHDSLNAEKQEILGKASADNNYYPQLKTAILTAQNHIEPEFNHQITDGGALKPLAIVRASVDLQLMGEPETNKSWSALRYDLDNNGRTCRDFDQVKFPMKIGEFNNLDDGLVGYWQVFSDSTLSQRGYFPQSDMNDVIDAEGKVYIDAANFNPDEHDYVDKFTSEGVKNLSLSFADEPLQLLMLVDPEARTHVTTGIVPKKTLFLEPQYYQEALTSMQSEYFAAPILTPIDTLSLSLPQQRIWQWRRINEHGGVDRTANVKVSDRLLFVEETIRVALLAAVDGSEDDKKAARLTGLTRATVDWQALLSEGVLVAVADWPDHAYYFDIEEAINEGDFHDDWVLIKPRLMVATRQGVVAPDTLPALGSKVHVVEGWLTPLAEITSKS